LPSPCSCNTRVYLGSYNFGGGVVPTTNWNSFDLGTGIGSSVVFSDNPIAGTLNISFTGGSNNYTDRARYVDGPFGIRYFNPYTDVSVSTMSGLISNVEASLNSDLIIRLGLSTTPTGNFII